MNVGELIDVLGKLDPATPVVVRTYDVQDEGQLVRGANLVAAVAEDHGDFTLLDKLQSTHGLDEAKVAQSVAVLEVDKGD